MTENQLVFLIAQQISGDLAESELEELRNWAGADEKNQLLLERMLNEQVVEDELNRWQHIDANEGYMRVRSILDIQRKARIRRMIGWSVAASLILSFGVLGLWRKPGKPILPSAPVATTKQPVLPGRNTAILRLSNGREIQLDSAGNGNLTMEGNARLVKLDSGSLSYVAASNDQSASVIYNTLTTPRSGQFQLRLPDGSRVWLNNASSLRYPTSFQGKTREVELSGEAYFEIVKNTAQPFRVKTSGEDIEVLGTSFNIMAYPEEATIQTTLLTGGVRVNAAGRSIVLAPDEQAQLSRAKDLTVLKNVPSQDIVSWKDGFFYFGRASFAVVMNQLARWYDVKVVYEGKVPDIEFGGKIDRSLPLDELLRFLDKSYVHFRLEGHTLVVLPS